MPAVCDGLEPPITQTRYATIRGSLRLDHYFTNTFPIQTTFFMVDQDHEFSSLDGEVVLSRDWLSHLFGFEELMDQMCMSMVKLQGRLQFSHKAHQGAWPWPRPLCLQPSCCSGAKWLTRNGWYKQSNLDGWLLMIVDDHWCILMMIYDLCLILDDHCHSKSSS